MSLLALRPFPDPGKNSATPSLAAFFSSPLSVCSVCSVVRPLRLSLASSPLPFRVLLLLVIFLK